MNTNYYEERPWGSFEILLDEKYCKVKRIIVKPGQRLSYQYHHKRAESWVIVQGIATVTLNDKVVSELSPVILSTVTSLPYKIFVCEPVTASTLTS